MIRVFRRHWRFRYWIVNSISITHTQFAIRDTISRRCQTHSDWPLQAVQVRSPPPLSHGCRRPLLFWLTWRRGFMRFGQVILFHFSVCLWELLVVGLCPLLDSFGGGHDWNFNSHSLGRIWLLVGLVDLIVCWLVALLGSLTTRQPCCSVSCRFPFVAAVSGCVSLRWRLSRVSIFWGFIEEMSLVLLRSCLSAIEAYHSKLLVQPCTDIVDALGEKAQKKSYRGSLDEALRQPWWMQWRHFLVEGKRIWRLCMGLGDCMLPKFG